MVQPGRLTVQPVRTTTQRTQNLVQPRKCGTHLAGDRPIFNLLLTAWSELLGRPLGNGRQRAAELFALCGRIVADMA